MNNKLYFDCSSGISGDMTVAALLDLAGDEGKKVLEQVLSTIPGGEFSVKISRVVKAGLDCCDFDVVLDAEHDNHDHDMAYLYGHEGAEHGHSHETHDHSSAEHGHSHEMHTHGDAEHGHSHVHRSLADVTEILNKTEMTDGARALAIKIFDILADAEAKAHGKAKNEVHFHEVGALDSIADVVSAAVLFDFLQVKECVIPSLCEGSGTIRCAHGILPIPVPAVANIVTAHGLTLEMTGVKGELVTPTGAAIAAAVRTTEVLPKKYKIKKIGLGAGKREYERPGFLRAMLIECGEEMNHIGEAGEDSHDTIWKLESNIDDCSGEILGYTMELLLEAGARDVHYHPVYMKKNRPAWQLNVICKEEDIPKLEMIIFRETTTIGIRRQKMERSVLKRQEGEAATPWGLVKVKIVQIGEELRSYPEYESAAKIAKENGISLQSVYNAIRG